MLVFLEDDDAGALAQDEAVAVAVERTAGAGGLIVAGRQGPGGAEAREAHGRQRGLGAAGDHDIGLVALDGPERQADGIVGAGTGVGDAHGALLDEPRVLLLEFHEAADAAADDRARPERIRQVPEVEARVLDGLDGARHGHLREPVEVPRFALVDPGVRIEVLDLARDLRAVLGHVETLDAADAGLAGQQPFPEHLHLLAQRGDEAQTRD